MICHPRVSFLSPQKTLELECPECKRGNTTTGIAMERARTEMLVSECGVRDDVARVVVVLTDGKSTEREYIHRQV